MTIKSGDHLERVVHSLGIQMCACVSISAQQGHMEGMGWLVLVEETINHYCDDQTRVKSHVSVRGVMEVTGIKCSFISLFINKMAASVDVDHPQEPNVSHGRVQRNIGIRVQMLQRKQPKGEE